MGFKGLNIDKYGVSRANCNAIIQVNDESLDTEYRDGTYNLKDTDTKIDITMNCKEGFSFNPLNIDPPKIDYSRMGLFIDSWLEQMINITENELKITYDSSYKTIHLIIENTSKLWNYIYTGDYECTLSLNSGVKATTDEQPEITRQVFITGTLENCTCNYTDSEAITGEKTQIIITANDGFEFDGIYQYRKDSETETFINTGNQLYCNIDLLSQYYYLFDNYIATKKAERISDFTLLYNPSENDLNELSKIRFNSDSDMGQYILALFKIPFIIPSEMKTGESNIILGTFDTELKTYKLLNYILTVDLGTITIPEKYNNVYDYMSTQCILNLPFFDRVYLNTEYVIGQTIKVIYTIDLYSGNITANVISSFTGKVCYSISGVIALNIPFIQVENNNIINYVTNINKNAYSKAFIEVVRNIPYSVQNPFGKNTVDYGTIGDYKGFIKVSDIVLNSSATNSEKEEIESLLKQGVFINENV